MNEGVYRHNKGVVEVFIMINVEKIATAIGLFWNSK